MSVEAVTQFLQRLAEDGVFQRRLDTFVAATDSSKPVASADLVEFAAEHGYEFTVKELRRATSHSARNEPVVVEDEGDTSES